MNPKIYIPFELSEEALSYVLTHEYIHLQRKDHLVKAFACLVLSIHWFNPLVWVAFYLAEKDMELSCDLAVMENCDLQEREAYSMAILRTVKEANSKNMQMSTAFSGGKEELKARFENIFDMTKKKRGIALFTAVEKAADHVVGILCKSSGNENARDMGLSDLGQGKEPRKLGFREENAVRLFQMAFAVFKIFSAKLLTLFYEGENVRIFGGKAVREDMAGVSRIQAGEFHARDRLGASVCFTQKLGNSTDGVMGGQGKGGNTGGDQLFDERGDGITAVGITAV